MSFNLSRPRRLIERSSLSYVASRTLAERTHYIPTLTQTIRAEPAPLRSAQAQRARPAGTRWPPLHLYRLTAKGVQVALLFLFFHKRLCGPLANSRFHHKPDPASRPNSKLEVSYYNADKAIENIVDLLQAA